MGNVAHIIREPGTPDASQADILAALAALQGERFSADHREYALMQGALALGATWEQVAGAAGLDSPQAAQQRYDRLEKRIGP